MIPILYESTETEFASNGLGRLRDIITCTVTEERNGIYECDFTYPVTGYGYEKIQLGRIIAVEHDDTSDVQPFDIVSCSRPIEGVVEFHAVHISYRQTGLTVSATNVNSLADAFVAFGNSTPGNPFSYYSDKGSTGYVASFDGVPRSVRSILGGVEGSLLDAYGGEYEWDKWTVKLWSARGQVRNFTIRYGVNLIDYNEDLDYSGSYTSVVPYWADMSAGVIVKGSKVSSGFTLYGSRDTCIPLDLTEKFETKPTVSQLEEMAATLLATNKPYLPAQTISVDFVRLQDTDEYSQFEDLLECKLCDTIRVIFPMYGMSGQFKIVKTVYNVLLEKYDSMELGTLSTSLSEALGITNGLDETVKASDFFPIGSVYVTYSNTNPNGLLGYGTWSLIDKQFAQVGGSTGFTVNSTNASDGVIAWFRNGHFIWIRISFKNKVAISDGDQTWGTIDGATLGMSNGAVGFSVGTGYADGLNAIPQVQISWSGTTGTVKTVDWTTRATSYPTATGEPAYMQFIVPVSNTSMSDAACDKFFWKRTA